MYLRITSIANYVYTDNCFKLLTYVDTILILEETMNDLIYLNI